MVIGSSGTRPVCVTGYDIASQSSSLSYFPLLFLLEGDSGRHDNVSATSLLLPVRYMILKSYKASSLSHQICAAPNLLDLKYTKGLLSVYMVNLDPKR